jgi:hypothetical protein
MPSFINSLINSDWLVSLTIARYLNFLLKSNGKFTLVFLVLEIVTPL